MTDTISKRKLPIASSQCLSLRAHILERANAWKPKCIGVIAIDDPNRPSTRTVVAARVADYKTALLDNDVIERHELVADGAAQWLVSTLGDDYLWPNVDSRGVMVGFDEPVVCSDANDFEATVKHLVGCARLADDLEDLIAVYMVTEENAVKCVFCPHQEIRVELEVGESPCPIDDHAVFTVSAMNEAYPPYESGLFQWQRDLSYGPKKRKVSGGI